MFLLFSERSEINRNNKMRTLAFNIYPGKLHYLKHLSCKDHPYSEILINTD